MLAVCFFHKQNVSIALLELFFLLLLAYWYYFLKSLGGKKVKYFEQVQGWFLFPCIERKRLNWQGHQPWPNFFHNASWDKLGQIITMDQVSMRWAYQRDQPLTLKRLSTGPLKSVSRPHTVHNFKAGPARLIGKTQSNIWYSLTSLMALLACILSLAISWFSSSSSLH